MCPCHRAVAFHPAEMRLPRRSDFGTPCCLRPPNAGSALGSSHFRGHIAFTVITARLLVISPRETLSMGFQDFGDFGHPRHPAIRTTGLLTFALAGLTPAEHTSLTGRNFRKAGFPRYGWKAGVSGGTFPARRSA